MGLAGASQRLQQLASTAEKLYERLNELRTEISAVIEDLSTTTERVERLETQLDHQTALLEALADAEDIDVPKRGTVETVATAEDGEER